MTSASPKPPYPSLGEIYHALAMALGTRLSDANLNRLVREGDFDWALLDSLPHSVLQEPLQQYADGDFADAVLEHVLNAVSKYKKLVCKVPLDSLDRATALPLLTEHFFAPAGAAIVVKLAEQFELPPLNRLMDQDRNPAEEVFTWLDNSCEGRFVHQVYPGTTGPDRANRDLLHRWRSGIQLPDLASIFNISKDIEKQLPGIGTGVARDFRRGLIVSRAFAWFDACSPAPLRTLMLRQVLMGFPTTDLGKLFTQAVHTAATPYAPFGHKALSLKAHMGSQRPKEVGDQAKLATALREVDSLMDEFDADGRTRYFLDWLWALWHVQSGQLDDAFTRYQSAVEKCWYRAGDQQQKLVEEALVLAAHLDKRVFLKQTKHKAIALGLFPNPSEDEQLVDDWEIQQWQRQFHEYFPAHAQFPECSGQTRQSPSLPFLVFDPVELEKIRPDLAKLGRVRKLSAIDQQTRRYPQLAHFASEGDVSAVQALLAAGAEVDQLDSVGGSALLCALQRLCATGDRGTADLLLSRAHSPNTLNSRTACKRWTPLLVAVDHGDPEIVRQLLAMGADSDLPGRPENMSPLYFALSLLMNVRDPDAAVHRYVSSITSYADPERLRVLRRYNTGLADAFGRPRISFNEEDADRWRPAIAAISRHFVLSRQRRHPEDSLRQIIKHLLAAGASPNKSHDFPAPGRTPLMLAAEMDCLWAFEEMLACGGNPQQKDESGNDCQKIAASFGARDVLRFLARLPHRLEQKL